MKIIRICLMLSDAILFKSFRKEFIKIIYFLSLFTMISACSEKDEEGPPLFELLTPQQTGVDFENSLFGNDSLNVLDFDYMYNGGGVATGDFNNDGLPDLFFTGNDVSSRLYLNKGNLKFTDVTTKAGLTTDQWAEGVTVVDINNDGLSDIYVSTSSGYKKRSNKNLLFINNGISADSIPVFTEQAAEYGIADTSYNTQAAFFDYNKDGHLDLYVLSNAVKDYNRNKPRPRQLTGKGVSNDKLYRNNGNGTFTNVSEEAGILVEGYGLGLVISDINKDGWPDIYVANDFITNDILYINNGDGTFSNRIKDLLKHQSKNGMGTDVADYNNDGWSDIVVMDMMPDKNLRQKSMFGSINYDLYMLEAHLGFEPQFTRNTLQLNNGPGPDGNLSFSEIGQLAGVYKTDWSWASLFADFDNDGLKDLFISNGYGKDVTDMDFVAYSHTAIQFGTPEAKKRKAKEEMLKLKEVKMPNFIFRNKGDLTFSDESENWGFVQPSLSNGAAYADLDNDGDLDLVVNNINDPAFIYENKTYAPGKVKSGSPGYLKIKINGDSLNLQGLGSKLTLRYKNGEKHELQYYEHYLTRGYKSVVDGLVHFGLGGVTNIDSLEIVWNDGKYELLTDVKPGQVLELNYKNAGIPLLQEEKPVYLTFQEADSAVINYKHEAAEYVDFKIQPLLPHKHSEAGPGIAVGDVNADGLEDFFTGGNSIEPGQIFIQQKDGSFSQKNLTDKYDFDDMGSLFLDADGDGDLDLYVVSGGSRHPAGTEAYQDRLYFNDGSGNFAYQPGALPKMHTSGSVVTAADYDGDGDLDLFVGGRLVPQNYPLPAKSYLLQNDNGVFKDVTAALCPELGKMGLVTAAIWSDFDNDHRPDLILAGEWMPVTVLHHEKEEDGKIAFHNITEEAGLSETTGWWNSIAAGDFDHDGDMDYVAGNLGLNSRYKASQAEPVTLYAKDYDKNGTIDPVMFHYIMGENYPAHPRDVLTTQLSYLRGRFQLYSDYGKTTFNDFFAPGETDDAYVLKSVEFGSSLIENKGDGSFALKALPARAQYAPVNGILSRDFNGDGHIDLLLAGNSYAPETNTGRYDAGVGSFLSGDGKGNFKAVEPGKSGFFVNGDARAVAELTAEDGHSLILVSQHKDSLKAFTAASKGHKLVFKPSWDDQKAQVFLNSGESRLVEFYHGGSFLSQSTRNLLLPEETDSVVVISYSGKRKTFTFKDKVVAEK